MKLVGIALGMLLGASLVACGAGNNGGWVTKHGWDPSSRAPAPKAATAEQSDVPLSALDLENPYLKPAEKNAMGDQKAAKRMTDESPFGSAAKRMTDDSPYGSTSDSAKAKTDKSEKKLKGDEPGF